MRQVIAERLSAAKTIPHFYIKHSVNTERLTQVKQELASVFLQWLCLACCGHCLREPSSNSGYNNVDHTLIAFETIDISVAVALPEGLITPIIRSANQKNLAEIAVHVRLLSKKAKEGQLAPHEYKGGSFTVSNLGMFGTTRFFGILNPPQAAILSVGSCWPPL